MQMRVTVHTFQDPPRLCVMPAGATQDLLCGAGSLIIHECVLCSPLYQPEETH